MFGDFIADHLLLEIRCGINNNDYFCYVARYKATSLTEIQLGAHPHLFIRTDPGLARYLVAWQPVVIGVVQGINYSLGLE